MENIKERQLVFTFMTKNKSALLFEREQEKEMRSIRNLRTRRIKREGFKSEGDYWKNTNPFKSLK